VDVYCLASDDLFQSTVLLSCMWYAQPRKTVWIIHSQLIFDVTYIHIIYSILQAKVLTATWRTCWRTHSVILTVIYSEQA